MFDAIMSKLVSYQATTCLALFSSLLSLGAVEICGWVLRQKEQERNILAHNNDKSYEDKKRKLVGDIKWFEWSVVLSRIVMKACLGTTLYGAGAWAYENSIAQSAAKFKEDLLQEVADKMAVAFNLHATKICNEVVQKAQTAIAEASRVSLKNALVETIRTDFEKHAHELTSSVSNMVHVAANEIGAVVLSTVTTIKDNSKEAMTMLRNQAELIASSSGKIIQDAAKSCNNKLTSIFCTSFADYKELALLKNYFYGGNLSVGEALKELKYDSASLDSCQQSNATDFEAYLDCVKK